MYTENLFAQWICFSEPELQFHIHNRCNLKQGNSLQTVKLLSVPPLLLTATHRALMFLQVRAGDRDRHHHSSLERCQKILTFRAGRRYKDYAHNQFTHLFVNRTKPGRSNRSRVRTLPGCRWSSGISFKKERCLGALTQLTIPLKVPSKLRAGAVKPSSFKVVSSWGPKDKGTAVTAIIENFGLGLKN